MRLIWNKFLHDFVEITETTKSNDNSTYIMDDIKPFTSPVNGEHITSRSQLRTHEKKYNIKQVGNDWIL